MMYIKINCIMVDVANIELGQKQQEKIHHKNECIPLEITSGKVIEPNRNFAKDCIYHSHGK